MGGFGLFPRQRPAMCSEYLRAVPAIMKGLKPRNLMGHDIACSWIVIGPDRRRAPRCTIYINSFGATEEINEGIPLNSQRFLVCLVVLLFTCRRLASSVGPSRWCSLSFRCYALSHSGSLIGLSRLLRRPEVLEPRARGLHIFRRPR